MNGPICYFQVFLVRDGGSPTKAELIIRLHVGGNREIAEETPSIFSFRTLRDPRVSTRIIDVPTGSQPDQLGGDQIRCLCIPNYF
jgi:hypothetical protein